MIVTPSSDPDVQKWVAKLKLLETKKAELVAAGQWLMPADDLLTLIGQPRRETYHCRMLAWLFNPGGTHGLGTVFLKRVLKHLFREEGFPDQPLGDVVAEVEVEGNNSRADILLSGGKFRVLFEVKVDAYEQDTQCERLFDDFSNPPDTHFVFLTPRGVPPETAIGKAEGAFVCCSFGMIYDALVATAEGLDPSEHGTTALLDYLRTLEREFASHMENELNPRLRFYLENRKTIGRFLELQKLDHQDADRLFTDLEGQLKISKQQWPGDPELFFGHEGGYRMLLLHRREWGDGNDPPVIGVGLEWTARSGFFGASLGVRTDIKNEELRRLLDDALGDADWGSTNWWPKWKYLQPTGQFWTDLSSFRRWVIEEIGNVWEQSYPQLERAFEKVDG